MPSAPVPAGLTAAGSSELRPASAARFSLGPHERCLLRFQLSCGLASEAPLPGGTASDQTPFCWHEISIRRVIDAPAAGRAAASPAAAACFRVAVQLLPRPVVHRALRLYCPAADAGTAQAQAQPAQAHAVRLDQMPGAERLLSSRGLSLAGAPPGVTAELQLQQHRLLLRCPAQQAGTTLRFLLSAAQHGGAPDSSPGEAWEVFVHSLPAVQLAASLGSAAAASVPLPALGGAAAAGERLAAHWHGASGGDLSAAVEPSGGSQALSLRYEPSAVGRQELLLALVAGQGGGTVCEAPGRCAQQRGLLLVSLDSSGTRTSRCFEVAVPAGQRVSKRVRYCSPHDGPRRFRVRGLAPPLPAPAQLHVAQPAASGFVLEAGQEASIKLTFAAASEAGSGGGWAAAGAGRQGQAELYAVVESSADEGGGGSRVEEVFCVRVTIN